MSRDNQKLTGNGAIKRALASGVVNVSNAANGMAKLTSKKGLPGVFYVKHGNNTLDKQTAHKLLKILAYLGVPLLCVFLIIWPLMFPNIA